MTDDTGLRPEAEHTEEAVLWDAWGRSGSAGELELPEEILGLLDGTVRGESAAAARRRLATDPDLARAFGELASTLREIGDIPAVEPPGRLIGRALDLVPPKPAGRRGLIESLRELLSSPTPALIGAAAVVLLVTFVLREPQNGAERPALRAEGRAVSALVLLAPEPEARTSGAVRFAWTPMEEAGYYRVVLLDVAGGVVDEVGVTQSARLTVSAEWLTERLGPGTHDLHWVVRSRRTDGSEVSSAPGRFTWSAEPSGR